MIKRSFYEAMGGRFVGISNYRNIIQNAAFRQAAGNTARFLTVCIPLLIIVSFFIAVFVNSMGKSREWFKTIFMMPFAVPIASIVLLWKMVFDQNGYLNEILGQFGTAPHDWMNSESAFLVLVFSYLWKNTGYNMVLWIAGLSRIPEAFYEAARVDGAGRWECLWYITLPGLRSAAVVVLILSFVNSFKSFREAYLAAGDYPHESIYMLQHLFNNWFVSLDIQKMSAAAVILAGIIILFLIFAKKLDEGEEL